MRMMKMICDECSTTVIIYHPNTIKMVNEDKKLANSYKKINPWIRKECVHLQSILLLYKWSVFLFYSKICMINFYYREVFQKSGIMIYFLKILHVS